METKRTSDIRQKTPEIRAFPHRVYYVSCAGDISVLVAIDPHIGGQTIQWFDTKRQREMRIKAMPDNTDGEFTFMRADNEGGGTYMFTPMTLDVYIMHAEEFLTEPRTFHTLDELIDAFLQTRKPF